MNQKLVFIFLASIAIFSCKPKYEKITTSSSAKLSFSQDSILFDTIFSNIGSTTQLVTVYNDNSNAVKTAVKLGGGSNSSYTIYINGIQTTTTDIEIDGKDSTIILIKVLINPKDSSLPYLVHDSIVFTTNGNVQSIQLEAYGQDANFVKGTLGCNITWSDPKPYVLYNTVTVPTGCTLTISKGTKVYGHNKALLVVNGTLIVQGVKSHPVVFAGDRLESYYNNVPGQWTGIIFGKQSASNTINWAIIKNAIDGIQIDPHTISDTIPHLLISNSTIENMQDEAVKAVSANLYAYNCLLTNTASYIFSGDGGGNYYFTYCTFAGYSPSLFRMQPSLQLSNTCVSTDSFTVSGAINGRLINSIVWGDGAYQNELLLNKDGINTFTFPVSNSILYADSTNYLGAANKFKDPLFQNPYAPNYHVDSVSSPALKSAIPVLSILNDLDSLIRSTSAPTMGAYEK